MSRFENPTSRSRVFPRVRFSIEEVLHHIRVNYWRKEEDRRGEERRRGEKAK